jgi:hypothetical protein
VLNDGLIKLKITHEKIKKNKERKKEKEHCGVSCVVRQIRGGWFGLGHGLQ